MKEKINVRIAEVKVWGDLADILNTFEENTKCEIESLTDDLKEQYPDGGAEVKNNWRYDDIQKAKAKLLAIENVRATILKAMG